MLELATPAALDPARRRPDRRADRARRRRRRQLVRRASPRLGEPRELHACASPSGRLAADRGALLARERALADQRPTTSRAYDRDRALLATHRGRARRRSSAELAQRADAPPQATHAAPADRGARRAHRARERARAHGCSASARSATLHVDVVAGAPPSGTAAGGGGPLGGAFAHGAARARGAARGRARRARDRGPVALCALALWWAAGALRQRARERAIAARGALSASLGWPPGARTSSERAVALDARRTRTGSRPTRTGEPASWPREVGCVLYESDRARGLHRPATPADDGAFWELGRRALRRARRRRARDDPLPPPQPRRVRRALRRLRPAAAGGRSRIPLADRRGDALLAAGAPRRSSPATRSSATATASSRCARSRGSSYSRRSRVAAQLRERARAAARARAPSWCSSRTASRSARAARGARARARRGVIDWALERDLERSARGRARRRARGSPPSSARRRSRSLRRRRPTCRLLKLETLQRTGSFKVRGAAAAITAGERPREIVAASTGNHGLAVAAVARALGHPVPRSSSRPAPRPAKLARLRAAGVEPHAVDGRPARRRARRARRRRSARPGALLVSPYNDPEVVLGQASDRARAARGAREPPDALFAPVGGGGLIGGHRARGARALAAHAAIVGCVPAASPAMARRGRGGPRRRLAGAPTLADATAGNIEPGSITVPICAALVDELVLARGGRDRGRDARWRCSSCIS